MKSIYLLFLLMIPFWAFSQEIRGHVYNENTEPLSNITVTLKGTGLQTFTDEKGSFKMTVPLNTNTLQFSGTGFEKLDVPIDFKNGMNVQMTTKLNPLDEVQVIGYGTSTQRFNVGSVTKVKAEDIERQAISNPLAALQGRVPGLVVTASSGLPGASFEVQIRGQNSLNPSEYQDVLPIDNPLFIIDGVPFAPQNDNVNQFRSIASPGIASSYGNPHGGLSPFSNLNPSDIESIEVLRDADATAIYGSKGGNGVILITTKRGKSGKTSLTVNASTALSSVGKMMPMMKTEQYLTMRKEAFSNEGLIPNNIISDKGYAPDIVVFDNHKYTNWQKDLMGNTAHNAIVNATISGGSEQTQFRLGANLNRNTYVYKGDFEDTKGGFLFNLHHATANGKFTLDFSTNFSMNRNNSSMAVDLLEAFVLQPNYPSPLDENGDLVWYYKGTPMTSYPIGRNPYSFLDRKYRMENVLLNSNLQLSYKLSNELTFKSSFGYSGLTSDEHSEFPKRSHVPDRPLQASTEFGTNAFTTWIIEPQLTYTKKLNRLLFDVLLGTSVQRSNNKATQLEGSGYASDNLLETISGAAKQYASDSFSEYKYAALFGRVNLRLDDKYILNLNARRDGSSRFGPDQQFGNFGSIGAGWLFSEEALIREKFAFLSYGKLRGTYGITGSDAIGNYNYIPRWSPAYYPYHGELGYSPINLSNPLFSWAATKKLEFGLELGILDNKVLLNTTWYRNRSGNQLISYQLPALTGFYSVVENWDALVQNTGLEFTLQAPLLMTRNFSWNTSFNLSVPKNKLVSFPNLAESVYATQYIVGQPVGVLTKFKSAGVNPETGLFQFYDAKGNTVSNPEMPSSGDFMDYYNIGSLDPVFFGGLQNSFTFKNLHLDVFVEFKKQMGVNFLAQVYSYLPGQPYNQPAALLDRWQSPGDKSPYQKFATQDREARLAARNFTRSDGGYSDASFIRFRTISLSYALPEMFIRKTSFHSVRLHVNAQNLFTITHYNGNDPESQVFYGIPVLKTLGFGLQINL